MSLNHSVAVKQLIDQIITFLDKFMPIASCHLVEYFTKSLYTNCLNKDIKQEINDVGLDYIIDSILEDNLNSEKTSHLNEFMRNCKNFTLQYNSELCLNLNEFCDKLKEFGETEVPRLKLNVFMTPKKSHEVEVLSMIASLLHNICGTSHLIDIGCGRGYVSSLLALHHKIPVLGIDSSAVNTNSAAKRFEKLQKHWCQITKNSNQSLLTKSGNKFDSHSILYKQITRHVNLDINLKQLIEDNFSGNCKDIGVIGLHTCGNLANTSLKLFAETSNVKSICNISCCYHLLFEKGDNEANDKCGFPMSDYFLNKNYKLGRNAIMLSAQSIDRITFNKQLPNKSIFFRAILQVILNDYCNVRSEQNVGKLKKFNNFLDYYKIAMEKLKLESKLNEYEIEKLLRSYEEKYKEINAFCLIRYMLAPVIESLILLDRLLYLHERNIKNIYLVQLFNPLISPRCYGIIALKNLT